VLLFVCLFAMFVVLFVRVLDNLSADGAYGAVSVVVRSLWLSWWRWLCVVVMQGGSDSASNTPVRTTFPAMPDDMGSPACTPGAGAGTGDGADEATVASPTRLLTTRLDDFAATAQVGMCSTAPLLLSEGVGKTCLSFHPHCSSTSHTPAPLVSHAPSVSFVP
jgi:hypothetical protein